MTNAFLSRGARTVIALALCTAAGSPTLAQHEGRASIDDIARLVGGEWVIDDAQWSFGMVSDVRQVYHWGPGRASIIGDVYVSDDGGPEYHRYRTIYACAEGADTITAYTFAKDGSVAASRVHPTDGGRVEFAAEGPIEQSITFEGEDSFHWHVEQVGPDGARADLMKSTAHRRPAVTPASQAWRATPGALAASVDDLDDRAITHERTVDERLNEVWRLWTTPEGLAEWLVGRDDERRPNCNVELRIGGPYEFFFVPSAPEGERGGEGNVVLSFEPRRTLAFTWNAPPQFAAERERRTWVVVHFEAVGEEQTKIELVHMGWPTSGWADGSDWPDVYAYFDRAWASVLGALESFIADRNADPTRVHMGRLAELAPWLSPLTPMLGDWECTSSWADGRAFWGRKEARPLLGGAFMQTRIIAKDDEQGVYPRYYQVVAWDRDKGAIVAYDFRYDGAVHVLAVEADARGGVTFTYPPGARIDGTTLRSTTRPEGDDACRWEVEARVDGVVDEWTEMMDGRWERAG